ncbi:MAG: EAL domain-containing protein [Clostridia bacterium]|nr:EAL domain-containing protein [Clostridia bacterium]
MSTEMTDSRTRDQMYFEHLEQLTGFMTTMEEFDIPAIFAVMGELCKILRVSKGVTTFSENSRPGRPGTEEAFVCYDDGKPNHLASSMRVVTSTHMVISCDVYQADDVEPLDELERKRVELIQRMMLTCLNRSRQDQIIERLTFYDVNGYKNLSCWFANLNKRAAQGNLHNMVAIRFNLKHFSLINEQIGRTYGDQAMRAYANLIDEQIQPDGLLCRIGGDNFIILMNRDHLDAVVKILRGAPVVFDPREDQRVKITSVAGVYALPETRVPNITDTVMNKVTAAYNRAKENPSGNIIFYSDKMQRAEEHAIRIQQMFNEALESREFVAYYQPKVDIRTRELVGAEALCRWIRDGKIIQPMDFIPVLERGMDICRLDFHMLDIACKDIRRWLDEGKDVVQVSVNLSRRHMMDPDLLEHIISIIDQNNVPHQYIEIELTETMTDVEFSDLKRIVHGLQAHGISTSVDDFGSGYSSLNLIKQIPWNVMKLDKSILPAEGEDLSRGSRMFQHVVNMAHEIGLKCVAEGVETKEQLAIMDQYGCRVAQGYYFDRPLPVQEFEKRLIQKVYQQ